MANQIILKKSSQAGKIPVVSDLNYGEIAINYADGVIYYKRSDNTIQAISGSGGGGGGKTSMARTFMMMGC